MHLYRLPWPEDVLRDLGEISVRMRVTLSYFIEPSPGEVGWQDRYRYASHALRFELNGPGESEAESLQRVNRKAREDVEEHPGTEGPGDRLELRVRPETSDRFTPIYGQDMRLIWPHLI